MNPKTLVLLILIFLLVGCPKKNNFQYDTIITDVPVNLDIINSVYDDFNSDLLYLGGRYNIISSTNKGSKGEHFDIVCIPINVSYHDEDDILDFNFYNTDYTPFQERELLSITNTIFEELGSYSFYDSHKKLYLFFANNEDGDFDIKMVFTDTRDWGHYDSQYHVYAPVKSNITNSASDELYPTIDQGNAKLLFCSNRDSRSFNIYELELDFETQLYEYLPISDSIPISHNTILWSNADDKCPSITNDLLVFTSNRAGVYGGYDLYYSLKINNEWSTPVNFGSKINTEYDEYRPITFKVIELFDLMVFSTNRPNGKGGFDLYCVKMDELIE